MPRLRIIMLTKDLSADVAGNTFNYVFWADVPAARQIFYADPATPPTRMSAWKGATAADNTALQNGSVVEQPGSIRVTPGTGMAAVQVFLQQQQADYQTQITNHNPWQRYGSTLSGDGTTWTVANNG